MNRTINMMGVYYNETEFSDGSVYREIGTNDYTTITFYSLEEIETFLKNAQKVVDMVKKMDQD